MKKTTISVGIAIIMCFMLANCTDTIEKDAKDLAELLCKSQKLSGKTLSGETSNTAESMALAADAALLSQKMEGKYSSEEENQRFQEAYLKEMAKCK